MNTMNPFIGKFRFSARRSLFRSLILIFFFNLGALLPGFGQTLEEFETAANSKGAGLIPYPDMRKEANSLEDEVTRRQKEAAGKGPSTLGPEKNKILKARKYSEDQLKKAQAEYDKYKSSNSGSFNPWADDVEKYKKEIEQYNKDLEAINRKIDEGIEALDRFWNARGGLREHFSDVISKLKSSKSNPSKHIGSAPSSSDAAATKEYKAKQAELDNYIETIIRNIEAGVENHKREEDITKRQSEELKTLKGRTAPF